ncbi:MAG: SUMF1/EgtB/PvdO family nonheme iron enzyme [Xanthomonadaceae bacterium]|nr:SUMF1/EgtB/PvdO family nonheme iron enzyme [Xanthomonadaceae bacterium]
MRTTRCTSLRHGLPGLVLLAVAAATAHADVHYRPLPAAAFRSALAIDGASARIALPAFAMRTEPVTVAEFASFLAQHPQWQRDRVLPLYANADYLRDWQTPTVAGPEFANRQPVTQVSWFAARAYCASEHARLPRWYEWEYAAAADATRPDARSDPVRNQRLLADILRAGGEPPRPIATQPANFYGIADLGSLVWEWTEDYAAMFPNADARVAGGGPVLALCGGSALAFAAKNEYALMLRVAALTALQPIDASPHVGFRCVRDPE